jgi:hypothetical protein
MMSKPKMIGMISKPKGNERKENPFGKRKKAKK